MGSLIYSFLNESFLLDPVLIGEIYASISESELRKELSSYREFCLSHLSELSQEVEAENGKLQLFAGENLEEQLLHQAAFYLDTVIFTDPLFRLSLPEQESRDAWSQAAGMTRRESLDRHAIAGACSQLLRTRSLVACGYVRYFPTSYFSEPPDQMPILHSENGFSDVLPEKLLEQYQCAARVGSVIQGGGNLLVQRELKIGRRIYIEFEPGTGSGYSYVLFEQEVLSVNEDNRTVQFAMRLPEEPPEKESFKAWVAQSINQAARAHFIDLSRDVKWASKAGAMFMTDSSFVGSILGSTHPVGSQAIETSTAQNVLNLDLPYFRNVSFDNLMIARQEGEAFLTFRKTLEREFRELRLEPDAEKRRLKTENAMHELLEVQRTAVEREVQALKRKTIFSLVGAGFTLAAAVPTSGFSLLGLLAAGAHGYKTYNEYQDAVKERPAYFMWRAGGGKLL
jgi:hypothetical protein